MESPGLMLNIPFSFAFYSVLGGRSSIGAHFGPCNLRLRCHFPLIVPKGKNPQDIPSQNPDDQASASPQLPECGMEIGGKVFEWKQGEPVYFDDSYEHKGKHVKYH